jgi:hypothetical protein
MDECDVVTGLRGVLAEMPDDSSNGVLCGIIDELKCDVVSIGDIYYDRIGDHQYVSDDLDCFTGVI